MFKEKPRIYLMTGSLMLGTSVSIPSIGLKIGLLLFTALCFTYTVQLWIEEDCKHEYTAREYKVLGYVVWRGKSCTRCTHQIGN